MPEIIRYTPARLIPSDLLQNEFPVSKDNHVFVKIGDLFQFIVGNIEIKLLYRSVVKGLYE